ncbi:MAG: ribonuclease Z [Actinobacteria bacterium]|nr:ribonuclease Z [Actinomycetota bacterium]
MDVRLLGSGGWVPSDRRETASVYLREGANALVLDAGTGFRRLLTDPDLLEGVERVSVVLSHFHLDHTAGLVCAHALAGVPVREVWAPGRLIAGSTADDLVHRLLGPPFLAADRDDVLREILTGIHELEGDVTIGPFTIETRVQPRHAGPTVALKVNGELAYCTDTAYDEENAVFVRGARVLLHEAFHASDETDDPIHSAAGEAARIAAAAEVERLVLVHVHPLLADDDDLLGFAAKRFPASEVGRDGPLLGSTVFDRAAR